MSRRAAWILVDGGVETFVHEDAAWRVVVDLVRGPEGVRAHARTGQPVSALASDADLSAICVVDFGARRVLVDPYYETFIPRDIAPGSELRARVDAVFNNKEWSLDGHFAAVAPLWPGWRFEWLEDGVYRVAEYLAERGAQGLRITGEWTREELSDFAIDRDSLARFAKLIGSGEVDLGDPEQRNELFR